MRQILNIDPVRDSISNSYHSTGYAWHSVRRGLSLSGMALSAMMLAGAAMAADMPMKAAVAPVFHWTGCYVGINGGGAASGSDFTSRVDPGTHLVDPADLATVNSFGTGSANDLGFIGGGQAGCNFQTARSLPASKATGITLAVNRHSAIRMER